MNDRPETQPSAPHSVMPPLVNAIALKESWIRSGDGTGRVLDISHLRVVIEAAEPWASQPEGELMTSDFSLDRSHFTATIAVRPRRPEIAEGALEMGFERILPSARSSLRAFLSPKKVGESLIEVRRADRWRHYHGLNESELWFDPEGGIVFSYLDAAEVDGPRASAGAAVPGTGYAGTCFVIQLADPRGPLRVGKLLRQDWPTGDRANEIADIQLPLVPLSDREAYAKLGECRDIVTNFRPSAPTEYGLKQRLLRAISETLYSTSHKVDMASARPSSVPPPSDN